MEVMFLAYSIAKFGSISTEIETCFGSKDDS